jgi:hypothetical protein
MDDRQRTRTRGTVEDHRADPRSGRTPLSKICRLWKNVTRGGVEFFKGRVGDYTILVLDNPDFGPDDRAPFMLYATHSPHRESTAPERILESFEAATARAPREPDGGVAP